VSNRVEPEIPSITLDQDQLKRVNTPGSSTSAKNNSTNHASANATNKQSHAFSIVLLLALGGLSWLFFQENQKLQSVISNSEQRIQQLENQLSATGEEMGESTIALKAKLEAITEKTEKLWEEMDKLWASAWRRNQSEIKALRTTTKKQDTLNKSQSNQLSTAASDLNTLNEKLTSTEFNVNALADQLTAANNIQNEISKITTQITSLKQKSSDRDSQQMEVATSVNQLEMSVTLLIERLEVIEKSINQNMQVSPSIGQ